MISIILPARNESLSLESLLISIRRLYPSAEVILVDDGSDDSTGVIAETYVTTIIHHPYSKGNGAAIKTGARAAEGDILVFMDADGQHQPEDIPRLLDKMAEGYDMVVGARAKGSQANTHRAAANGFYNWFASWMVGQRIEDLTSGFRAVKADKFRQFLYLLPNGFSYPTTITMSFFRAGYSVAYLPIHTPRRIGKSHMKIWKDGLRFLLIIFKIGTLYSPLKLFFPISLFFFLAGVAHYIQTYLVYHRFTNMSAMLLITSVMVFLVGLVSEQITLLNYRDSDL